MAIKTWKRIKWYPSVFFVIFFSLSFLISINNSYAENKDKQILPINPFKLKKERLAPARTFEIQIDNESFKPLDGKVEVSLRYKIRKDNKLIWGSSIPLNNYFVKGADKKIGISCKMPSWEEMIKTENDIRTQSSYRGCFRPYKAELEIDYTHIEMGKIEITPFPVEVQDHWWASFWGIIAVLISFVIIWWLKPVSLKKQTEFAKDISLNEWGKANKAKRFFLYPLHFAITPIGTYSISIAQVLLWTYITIFGLIYVYWLTGSFIDITAQVLTLLGIGGGTALASKINAVSRARELPPKYLGLIIKKRIPKLQDLICIGGQPNIYKFQMLAFTLITGCIVLAEIVGTYTFPVIPDSLVTLMGISGAVYLGNEFTQKNIWDEIEKRVDAIEKLSTKGSPLNTTELIKNSDIPEVKEEVEQLKKMLDSIYS